MKTRSDAVTPPANETDEAQTLSLRLWVALARAYNAVAARAEEDIARHDLTVGEFAVVEVLFHKGPMLLGEVQRRVLVSSGGITYLVDRLQRRGLVERRAHPDDRRARIAALTPEGAALVRRIFPEHAARIKEAMRGLGKQEKREAMRLLRTLAAGAGEGAGSSG
jgi:MarR family 2-MHQ and catechol resistance regulon transcriptional repressor